MPLFSLMPLPLHHILSAVFLCVVWVVCVTPARMGHASEDFHETLHEELDDARIAVAIKQTLIRGGGKSFSSIDVTVKDGVAMLTGTVESLWAQERARELSQVIRGVRGVIERLSVGPVGSMADSTLTGHLEHLFLHDPIADFQHIHIEVDQGVVTLKGQVQSWQEQQTALKMAKMVKGVRKVVNALTVKWVTGRSDTRVREDIRRRLEFDVWIDRPSWIRIRVREGQVLLSGQVRSAAEKNRAAELAWVPGVREVEVDEIKVIEKPQDPMVRHTRPTPTDQQITEALRMILSYDPQVSPFDLNIEVRNGHVTLKGHVPFLSVKREAEQDVHNTLGVRSVDNQLVIQATSTFEDTHIRTRVLTAFSHDPVLEQYPLAVAVRKGTVHITGTVDSVYERNHAGNVTSRIQGVRAIHNGITFTARNPQKTDWEIQLDIENQVWWNPFLSDQDIVAMVENGKATLTGSVEYSPQRIIAEQQAFEAGASEVVNQLRVGKIFNSADQPPED